MDSGSNHGRAGASAAGFLFLATVASTLASPAAAESSPVARAPGNFEVATLEPFELNGSASFDPDHDPIACDWGWPGSPRGWFDDASACTTVFHPEARGVFLFQLQVRDPQGLSDWAAVDVAVNDTPPQIVAFSPPESEIYAVETQFYSGSHPIANSANVFFSVAFRDPDEFDAANATGPDDQGAVVEWFVDGKFQPSDSYSRNGTSSSSSSLWTGDHTVRAEVTDYYFSANQTWTVHVLPPGSIPPTNASAISTDVALAIGAALATTAVWGLRRRALRRASPHSERAREPSDESLEPGSPPRSERR